MAIRGGYGIFFEYGMANEANAESLEARRPEFSPPASLLFSNGPNSF